MPTRPQGVKLIVAVVVNFRDRAGDEVGTVAGSPLKLHFLYVRELADVGVLFGKLFGH